MKKSVIILLTCISLFSLEQTHCQDIILPTTKQEPFKANPDLRHIPTAAIDTLTIIGVGDIMLGTDYPYSSYLHPSKTCNPVMANVIPLLKDADVTFGNFEGSLAGNKGTAKHCNNPDQCYVFRMPVEYADCMVEAGFDLISVANNHVNDFGYEGRKNTANVLDNAGLSYAGFKDKPYTIKEINGVSYALCAFAPHSGTADLRNTAEAAKIVAKLDTIVDVVIVSFHGGAEGSKHQHVTRQKELFYGANRGNVYEFSHAVIDAGADVVFGHGPHVTRAIELYKTRLICYSLGNFATYRRFNLSGPNGIAPMVKVKTNTSGEFLTGTIIPIFQEGQGIPKLDPQKRVITKLQELTAADFPEGNLTIENNGTIRIKE